MTAVETGSEATMRSDDEEYQRQIDAQIGQYADVEDMHVSSAAAGYLNTKYLSPKFQAVFGTTDVAEIYGRTLAAALGRTGGGTLISLGAGYGSLEVGVVGWLKQNCALPFRMIGTDLSPILVERATAAASEAGLGDLLSFQVLDLNGSFPFPEGLAGIMVNHALHHFVELEHIFAEIDRLLHPEGTFVTFDMIGRNGHMRWPETLALTREIWSGLPARYKWNHQRSQLFEEFDNWDCSVEGFEGIRAQDILPELLKRFRFESFVANLGLADVFMSPGFGPNFDPSEPRDAAFLDEVQRVEDTLIAQGVIKPIQMFAAMRTFRSATCPPVPRVFRAETPERSLRRPKPVWPATIPSLADLQFANPYADEVVLRPLPLLTADREITFGDGAAGRAALRWGWSEAEPNFTWSSGLDSALEFQVADDVSSLDLKLVLFRPRRAAERRLEIRLNGTLVTDIGLGTEDILDLSIPATGIGARERVLLEFHCTRPRRPDIDGDGDRRPIGLAVLALTLRSAGRPSA